MSNHLLKAGLALESDKYTRALFSRALKTSKGWSLCNPFGQPALLLSFTHGGGKVFFICNLNFLCFKFYLFCHAPIMHDSDTLTLSSLKPSHCGVQAGCSGVFSPKLFPSPGWTSPSPSAASHRASVPHWDHSSWWVSFQYQRSPKLDPVFRGCLAGTE